MNARIDLLEQLAKSGELALALVEDPSLGVDLVAEVRRLADIEAKLGPLVERAITIRKSGASRQGLAMGLAAAHADIALTAVSLFSKESSR
jgi:hypothetical protein